MKQTIKHITTHLAVIGLLVGGSPVSAATPDTLQAVVGNGVSYLLAQQQPDGSIAGAFGAETDWSIIAIAASGQDPASIPADSGSSLVDFIRNDRADSDTPATTLERRILAIHAAGEDTTDFGGVNYNQLLAGQHNSQQIGDPFLLNDDSFAIMAIKAMADPSLTPIAQDALDYLITHQGEDGGFSYTTDDCDWCGSDSNDTAASIIALQAASSLGLTHDGLDSSRNLAVAYLLELQHESGGFVYDAFSTEPDAASTSWSLMALNSFADRYSTEKAAAQAWLIDNQNPDGGFDYAAWGMTDSNSNDTAHAILALLGTTWLLEPAPVTNSPDQTSDEPVAHPPTVIAPPQQFTPISSHGGTESAPTAQAASDTDNGEAADTAATVLADNKTSPAADTNQTDKSVAAAIDESYKQTDTPWLRYIGYGLIACATAGTIGYWIYQRRHTQNG